MLCMGAAPILATRTLRVEVHHMQQHVVRLVEVIQSRQRRRERHPGAVMMYWGSVRHAPGRSSTYIAREGGAAEISPGPLPVSPDQSGAAAISVGPLLAVRLSGHTAQ